MFPKPNNIKTYWDVIMAQIALIWSDYDRMESIERNTVVFRHFIRKEGDRFIYTRWYNGEAEIKEQPIRWQEAEIIFNKNRTELTLGHKITFLGGGGSWIWVSAPVYGTVNYLEDITQLLRRK